MRLDHSRTTRLLVLFAITTSSAANAQAPGTVAGLWTVQYEREWRKYTVHVGAGDSGPQSGVTQETARMRLTQRGDSVFGQWEPTVAAGEDPRPAQSIHGAVRGDSIRVQIDAPPIDGFFTELGHDIADWMKEHIHGIPRTTTFLEFVVRGNAIDGTRNVLTLDGKQVAPGRPLTAVREKT